MKKLKIWNTPKIVVHKRQITEAGTQGEPEGNSNSNQKKK